jgi:crotonobetaine/carnitine-CoA ligase
MELIDELRRWRVVPDRLRHRAETMPDRPFLDCGDGMMTFAEVHRRAEAVAGSLSALGIGKGDRVAVILPNCTDFAIALFALARLGAIQVPVNVFLKGDFLRHQMLDSGAVAVIADGPGLDEVAKIADELPELRLRVLAGAESAQHTRTKCATRGWGADGRNGVVGFAELERGATAAPAVEISPADLLAIMYTSGTTGAPKGCMLSHGYYTYVPWGWFENDWYSVDDHLITAMPMFHIAAQAMIIMAALQGGMPATVLPSFSAGTFLASAVEAGATMAFGVGPMGMALLASPPGPYDRAHRLRRSVWPPMPPAAREQFAERFGVAAIAEGYGQTEVNPLTQSPADRQGMTLGCLGMPSPYLDVAIVDDLGYPVPDGEVGEIVIRPREPMVMFSGYWRRPEATVEASRGLWHHTGDAGRRDERGYLVFVDRRKDAIRRRGENISSMEVEAVIARHPAIAAAAVHGVPAALGDDDVKAWLVAADGARLDPAELHAWFAEHLPYFAVPRYVQLTDQLPVNALGRVQKFKLKEFDNAQAWDFDALGLTIARDRRR